MVGPTARSVLALYSKGWGWAGFLTPPPGLLSLVGEIYLPDYSGTFFSVLNSV